MTPKLGALLRDTAADLEERITIDALRGILSFVRSGYRGPLSVQVSDGYVVDVAIPPRKRRRNAREQVIEVDDLYAHRLQHDARALGL